MKSTEHFIQLPYQWTIISPEKVPNKKSYTIFTASLSTNYSPEKTLPLRSRKCFQQLPCKRTIHRKRIWNVFYNFPSNKLFTKSCKTYRSIVFWQTDVMQPSWSKYHNVSYSCLPGPQFSAKWKAHKSFYNFTMNQLQSDGFKPWHHCRVVAAAKKEYNFQHGIAPRNQGQQKITSVVDSNHTLTQPLLIDSSWAICL